MAGVGGAQRPVMWVNEPKKMGFAERTQPTSLLDLLGISHTLLPCCQWYRQSFTSVFEQVTLQ
jgi:hypothetical protein